VRLWPTTSHGYVPSRQHGNPLHPRTFLALIRKTLSKWNDDPTLRFGAGLAYYTAFAVVPAGVHCRGIAKTFSILVPWDEVLDRPVPERFYTPLRIALKQES